MKLNREVLVGNILTHRNVFFKLLDYISTHDGASEIPENLYLTLYNTVICNDADDHVHTNLSIQSLIENGVFIHNDPNTGMITIERVIVDLLRFLDVKRARELTRSDFEHMRAQIVDAIDRVMTCELGTEYYADSMATFNQLMSEVHSKIKENVTTLTAKVEDIALKYKAYNTGETKVSIFDLYSEVAQLYGRYVLPCYEFINPSMEMAETQTFSKAVRSIIGHHVEGEEKEYEIANTIQFRKTAITSYYKDIAKLVRKLEQYTAHLGNEQKNYLALESAFSKLIESVVPLRHGMKRNTLLTRKSEVFGGHSKLDGLTNQKSKFSTKLQWDSGKTKLRFKEYLNTIKESQLKSKKDNLKSLPANINISEERKIIISKVLYANKPQQTIEDTHKFIFNLLQKHLDNFELTDVLYGIETFVSLNTGVKRPPVFSRNRLEHDVYFLDYIKLRYQGEVNV